MGTQPLFQYRSLVSHPPAREPQKVLNSHAPHKWVYEVPDAIGGSYARKLCTSVSLPQSNSEHSEKRSIWIQQFQSLRKIPPETANRVFDDSHSEVS